MSDQRCARCGAVKPVEEFYLTKKGHSTGWCRGCHSAYAKEWRSRAVANPLIDAKTRVCARCERRKPRDAFAPTVWAKFREGAWCRVCTAEYHRAWKAQKTATDPAYAQKIRERAAKWATKNREKNPEAARARGRERYGVDREYLLGYYHDGRRDPLKAAARTALKTAVKSGAIKKPVACQDCNKATPSRRLHAHHADYHRPFDVEWLCSTCHGKRHRTYS